MWIDDLTKALYFLNATDYKYSVCITKIEDNCVYFSNGRLIFLLELVAAYDNYISTGEIKQLW